MTGRERLMSRDLMMCIQTGDVRAFRQQVLLAVAGLLFFLGVISPLKGAQPGEQVSFDATPGSVAITIAGRPFASYFYADKTISRPYFAQVRAPNGEPVTRNHPPVAGRDLADHAALHPGIWMSFGDVNGSDYWRNKAPVVFERFIDKPQGGTEEGGFSARYSYRDQQDSDKVVCNEDFRCRVHVIPAGYLVLWDSTFSADKEIAFGDQEEMGIGFRIATPLRAERKAKGEIPPGNGEIVNSHGAHNEKEVWGAAAEWCDYAGESDDQRVGIAILCHPHNFRPSRFHARDYGLLVANPFGRAAFHEGEPSRVVVRPSESLRLRYGVLVHSSPSNQPADIAAAYKDYIKLAAD
jgi:hypothetical protein